MKQSAISTMDRIIKIILYVLIVNDILLLWSTLWINCDESQISLIFLYMYIKLIIYKYEIFLCNGPIHAWNCVTKILIVLDLLFK